MTIQDNKRKDGPNSLYPSDLAAIVDEKLEELLELAEMLKVDLGDNKNKGVNQRPAGWIDNPKYMILKK